MSQQISVEPEVSDEYDIIVVGSGEGGKYLAWTMARQGKRALVIERRYIGGRVRTSPASPARTSFTAPKSRRLSPEVRSLEFQKATSEST
jgi:choline dehydrogenase-like flavoprotein